MNSVPDFSKPLKTRGRARPRCSRCHRSSGGFTAILHRRMPAGTRLRGVQFANLCDAVLQQMMRRAFRMAFLRRDRDSGCPKEASAALAPASSSAGVKIWDSDFLAEGVTTSWRGTTHVASPRCLCMAGPFLQLSGLDRLCHWLWLKPKTSPTGGVIRIKITVGILNESMPDEFMVRHRATFWNHFFDSLFQVDTKLTDLGFHYSNGEVTILEPATDREVGHV